MSVPPDSIRIPLLSERVVRLAFLFSSFINPTFDVGSRCPVRGTLVARYLLSSIVQHGMPLILYKSSFLFHFLYKPRIYTGLNKFRRSIFGLYKFCSVLRASARSFSSFRSRYFSAAVPPFVNCLAWYAVCSVR